MRSHSVLRDVHRILFSFLSSPHPLRGSLPLPQGAREKTSPHKRPEANVYLFGSWATGKMRRHSDIDLGILPRQPLPLGTLSRIREAFEESRILRRVEIVDLRSSGRNFRADVMKHGIPWKE